MAAGKIYTYKPDEIYISFDEHIVSGYAEDSFVSVEPNADAVTTKVGCDGEIVRSINPDATFIVKLTLIWSSESDTFLRNQLAYDRETKKGIFPISIKNLEGDAIFSAEGWVSKAPARGGSREAPNREWELHTGFGKFEG